MNSPSGVAIERSSNGSPGRLPLAALNEYLCMQVAGKVLPSAKTEVSRDGNALVVHRFDVDGQGHPLWGMEDFCALLGLRPDAKYETTWERIARAVRDHVPGSHQYETFRKLAATLLLARMAIDDKKFQSRCIGAESAS
jgi:serine/threonine-protein kinase HipA